MKDLVNRFNKAYSKNSGLALLISDFETTTQGVFSINALAKKLNATPIEVRNALTGKYQNMLNRKCNQEVKRLWSKGYSKQEIQKMLDLTDVRMRNESLFK